MSSYRRSSGQIQTLGSQAFGDSDHQIDLVVVRFSQRMETIRWHRTTRMTARVVGAAVLAASLVSSPALAEDPEPDRWTITIAPYFWAAGIKGDVGVGNVDADVDVSFNDIRKDLTFGGMLLSEARKDRLGFFFAPLYVRLGDESHPGPFDIDVTSDMAVVGGGAFYRVAEWNIGRPEEGRSRKAWIEPLAGLRYTYLRVDIDVDGPLGLNPDADKHRDWVDPIIGASAGIDLSEHWVLTAEGDIGGFGVGSDFTWNAVGLISYQTSLFGIATQLAAGYRALSWDYDHDNFKWDVVMHGPVVGAIFRF